MAFRTSPSDYARVVDYSNPAQEVHLISLRRNSDGVVRTYTEKELKWHDHSEFWWSDGNAGCDCNRQLYFNRAAPDQPQDDDSSCGDDRFSVCIKDEQGNVLYEDDSWENK